MMRHAAAALPRVILAALPMLALSDVGAQSVYDTNLRAGPQLVQYSLKSPVNETISELVIPVFVVVPVNPRLTFDVGTAYASARVRPGSGTSGQESTISGLTDTQVRGNLTLGNDFVVLTAGVNLPTGRETAAPEEQVAAYRIGSDFLAFPISNLGTGLAFTGGVAVARPVGSWNLGFGGSLRYSSAYEPFEGGTGNRPRFQPGNEYRARVGLDRPFGTGRFALGVTYSTFGDDDIGGSIYNTGDRYVVQTGFTNGIGGADVIVNLWNLYRSPGTIFTGERVGAEDITNLLVGAGFRTFGGVLEPSVELRTWQQKIVSSSALGTLGLRYSITRNGFTITPSAGYTVGRLAVTGGTAHLTGFRGALAIRLGP